MPLFFVAMSLFVVKLYFFAVFRRSLSLLLQWFPLVVLSFSRVASPLGKGEQRNFSASFLIRSFNIAIQKPITPLPGLQKNNQRQKPLLNFAATY